MKKKSEVTILLTIFNRVDLTNKWLDCAEKNRMPFKIFISDGGNIKNIKEKLNLKNRKLDITYKKFKYYKNYNFIYEKYYYAVKNIKTKYIFISEDDDYIFANSIKKSQKFLDDNNEFSCVKGLNCLGELIINNKKILSLVLRNETSDQLSKSLVSKSPDLRLINYYKEKHSSLLNGLHRKKSLVRTFKILGTKNFYNLYITELIFCLSVVFNGKIKRKNHVDYIKMDNTHLSSSNNFQLFRPFSKICIHNKFDEENNIIFKSLKFSNLKNKKNFISLHNKFLENDKFLRIKIEKKSESFQAKVKKLIKRILLKFKCYYYLKYFYLLFFKKSYADENIMILDKSIEIYIKKNIKEFYKIVNFNRNHRL
jgi:glycosyltransferase domain-containing protein